MKLHYTKLSKSKYKFFYEKKGEYAEFYMYIHPIESSAEIQSKDPEYANTLTAVFHQTMTNTCQACEASKRERVGRYCQDHNIICLPKKHETDATIK